MEPLQPGTVLRGGKRDYTIVEKLGAGGFGITYRVTGEVVVDNISVPVTFAIKEYARRECDRLSDTMAMKAPSGMTGEIEAGLNDFVNEGKRLQQICLISENIVNVNEVFRANATAYYVMEYLNGGNIRDLVRNNGCMNEQQMLSVALPIGEAVQMLHNNRMLHLDIKPNNIMIRCKGNVTTPVLIDFGLTVHFGEDNKPTTTTPNKGLSHGYSPIEQAQTITGFAPTLDVYALAATCLYMLTGQDPKSAFEIKPEDISRSLQGKASDNVTRAIIHAMAFRKDDRTPTIEQFLAELQGNAPRTTKQERTQTLAHLANDPNATQAIPTSKEEDTKREYTQREDNTNENTVIDTPSPKQKNKAKPTPKSSPSSTGQWLKRNWLKVIIPALAVVALAVAISSVRSCSSKNEETSDADTLQYNNPQEELSIVTDDTGKVIDKKQAGNYLITMYDGGMVVNKNRITGEETMICKSGAERMGFADTEKGIFNILKTDGTRLQIDLNTNKVISDSSVTPSATTTSQSETAEASSTSTSHDKAKQKETEAKKKAEEAAKKKTENEAKKKATDDPNSEENNRAAINAHNVGDLATLIKLARAGNKIAKAYCQDASVHTIPAVTSVPSGIFD